MRPATNSKKKMTTVTDSKIALALALYGERSDEFKAALSEGGYTSHASGLFAATYDASSGDLHECVDPENPEMIVTVFCFR
jgi:hypothetical protein